MPMWRNVKLVAMLVLLLLVSAALLKALLRVSVEDNLTECAYEAEKLLVHMSAENADAKVKKRANLVYACMEVRRFAFDLDTYDKVVSRNPLPGAEDDLRKETFMATAASFWKRDWNRYSPF